MSNTVQ